MQSNRVVPEKDFLGPPVFSDHHSFDISSIFQSYQLLILDAFDLMAEALSTLSADFESSQ